MSRAVKILVAAGVVASLLVPATAAAAAGPKFTALTLQNGWIGGEFGTAQPAVALISNVVTFKGGLGGGTASGLFTLPAADRPATDVYVPVDLCSATNGRLHIFSDGQVSVETEGFVFGNAQCFVSLDGASFTLPEKGSKPLTLLNEWTNAPSGTSNAAVRVVGGVVRLQGAIAGGAENEFAVLPKADWPKATVTETVNLCNSAHGVLAIGADGRLNVFSSGSFSDAQCFTSLDGVSYVKADSASAAKSVVLQNGWQNIWTVRPAGLKVSGGVVRLEGSVSGGGSALLFTLPAKDLPAADVYVPAVTCEGSSGAVENARLIIQHSTGDVLVQTESGNFSDAQGCTYFDGSWFAQ